MTLQRYLGEIERYMMNRAPTRAVEYAGSLDENLMDHALYILCDRHPVLRAQIIADDHGFLLHVPRNHRPEFIVLDGDISTLHDEVERRWDMTDAVARLMLVRNSHGGYLGLRADHAIVDARALGALFAELWDIYTDVAQGNDVEVRSQGRLPAPPHELLARRWKTGGKQRVADEVDNAPPIVSGVSIEKRIRLSSRETIDIVKAARNMDTSVHALICGAIIFSLYAHAELQQSADIVCTSVVDLRNRVSPPVEPTETTNFIAYHNARISVRPDSRPISIGRDVKVQLDASLTKRDLPLGVLRLPPPPEGTRFERRMANVLITNAGIVPDLSHPEDLVIDDVLSIAPRRAITIFPVYAIHTYNGRMALKGKFASDSFTDEEAGRISNRIAESLLSLAIG